jgi:hypothetical protein
MPVLLAVTTSATICFTFLYLIRPSSGELGAIRVVSLTWTARGVLGGAKEK